MKDELALHLKVSGAVMPKRFRHHIYITQTCTVLSWNWTHVFFQRDDNNRRLKRLIADFFKEWKEEE